MFFTVYFFSLTYVIIKQKFQNKIYTNYVIMFYLALIIGAAIIYGLGFVTNSSQNVYTSTRNLIGIAQSFIPLMIVYLIIKYFPKS
jgi:magnesium-transporting ATPase (P-type)